MTSSRFISLIRIVDGQRISHCHRPSGHRARYPLGHFLHQFESRLVEDGVDALQDGGRGDVALLVNDKLHDDTTPHRLEDGTVFCPAEKLQSAIAKLKSGQELDFYEEYSIENLFHESVHARATRKTIIRAGSMDEKVMETCTQLYARDRYVKIMKAYGVKPVNFDKIMTDGLGYNFECRKLRRFFLKDGELQVGELINIANETESGTRIMVKKLMRMGIKEEDAINLLWNLL